MALEYNLYIKSAISPINVIARYFNYKDFSYEREELEGIVNLDVFGILGFIISIYPVKNKFFEYQLHNLSLEFEWNQIYCISFRFNKFFDYKTAKENMVDLVAEVLKNSSEDLQFLFNGDSLSPRSVAHRPCSKSFQARLFYNQKINYF